MLSRQTGFGFDNMKRQHASEPRRVGRGSEWRSPSIGIMERLRTTCTQTGTWIRFQPTRSRSGCNTGFNFAIPRNDVPAAGVVTLVYPIAGLIEASDSN